ncbi:hypothetical protein O6H91_04G097600 [Diphasiastrum complanatum]|uniref:Uncharacterized protein n=1 Tax=Diphasiastrum complanatum TaxID=34168 RepID=A0ACC2DZY0_DIPCM|nr:hypothetical protein O6H91_04G097600 [Diphasiastrum complanatum]
MATDLAMQLYSSNHYPATSHLSSNTKGNPESMYEFSISNYKGKKSRFWDLRPDSETKRKIRVTSYKAYSVERKMKSSVKNSFRWLKNKYYDLQYRWW